MRRESLHIGARVRSVRGYVDSGCKCQLSWSSGSSSSRLGYQFGPVEFPHA